LAGSGPAVRAAVTAANVCLRSDSCTPAERIADVPQVQVCVREYSARCAAPAVPLLTAPRRPQLDTSCVLVLLKMLNVTTHKICECHRRAMGAARR
jgi:hypothetical protein